MKRHAPHLLTGLALGLGLLLPPDARAFDSGSTGVDGVLNPTVDTVLQLPPDGVFNFTEVNIPAGVTVSFQRNARNTPVRILASGNVTIAGTIHVNGGWAPASGAAGDGYIGDDGLPGQGGPGGYDGGRGGGVVANTDWVTVWDKPYPPCYGASGLGPGGGNGGALMVYYADRTRFAGVGGGNGGNESNLLQPLVGGSGGGGGCCGAMYGGAGGGGGGGALLIASSGIVDISGSVLALGGNGGTTAGGNAEFGAGAPGASGGGGAIRIVATTISGNGNIQATGGPGIGHSLGSYNRWRVESGPPGGVGKIRLEAENMLRTAGSNPLYTFGDPAPVFIAGMPTLRIVSVAGVNAPAEPTGNADVVLPADIPNPVTVVVETTGVPVGNTAEIVITPAIGNRYSVVTPALTGNTDSATASVQVELPAGPSILLAQTTYTVLASLGDALSTYAQGERVERVRVTAALDGRGQVTLITISGKEYPLPMGSGPFHPQAKG